MLKDYGKFISLLIFCAVLLGILAIVYFDACRLERLVR